MHMLCPHYQTSDGQRSGYQFYGVRLLICVIIITYSCMSCRLLADYEDDS